MTQSPRPRPSRPRLAPALLAFVLAGAAGCLDFVRQSGPDSAPEVTPPRVVSVTVEYRQPNGCVNVTAPCEETVVFFGTWMRPGEVLILQEDPNSFVWRGTARNVPVNFPPRDEPYLVRIYDPHLRESETGGITANRLKVGAEALDHFDAMGSPAESALVFVDENGYGHNPY